VCEQPEPESDANDEERLPPLPIPKRKVILRAALQSANQTEESNSEGHLICSEPSLSDETEDVQMPSSSSDASSSPSTALCDELYITPKVVEVPLVQDYMPQRVSKRRRITDTFKGLFNTFGGSVTNAISFALDR
jgi:hypothetical protein